MINTSDYPTPITHYYTASKFMNGFVYNGFSSYEINFIEEMNKIEDSSDNIFLMSDHFYSRPNTNWMKIFEIWGNKFKKSSWIFWHFHNIYKNNYIDKSVDFPFKNYIFTGEYYRVIDDNVRNHWGGLIDWYMGLENYVKWPFAADVNPFEIESVPSRRKDIFDCGYVGATYKKEWTEQLKNSFNCFVHYYLPVLSEKTRIDKAFLSSKISLGFNSDSNAKLGLPTERVFEGLAYGCVVVTDCKVAEDVTDGIVKYISNYDELLGFVLDYVSNENLRKQKQLEGINYAKNYGTYYHVAKEFISKIESFNNEN